MTDCESIPASLHPGKDLRSHASFGATYIMTVKNPNHVCKGIIRMDVDGKPVEWNLVPVFSDAKEHHVHAVLG